MSPAYFLRTCFALSAAIFLFADTYAQGKYNDTIAYVRGGTELRMISADGKNDRRVWTHPDLTKTIGIYEIAWRPDGGELVVSAGHEAVASLYHSDLYTLKPDGTGLRRLTNGPDRNDYPKFKKGTVTVAVRNGTSVAVSGTFFIYVAGADLPQQVNIPAGTAKTLVFKDVVDLGSQPQPVVAIQGPNRWFVPGPDVQAGRNVTAPQFNISGGGIELLGAFRPVWKADGSRISYRNGLCVVSTVPAKPAPGHQFQPLFKGAKPVNACSWDWGPTAATANQILYASGSGSDSAIYRVAEGGAVPGEKIVVYNELPNQIAQDLRWLPDGSGFLYSHGTITDTAGNIYRYDFATGKSRRIAELDSGFARGLSISPDGKWVVFERAGGYDDYDNVELWIVGTDGIGMRLLVKDGQNPAWGR